jgi:hypothetical protein
MPIDPVTGATISPAIADLIAETDEGLRGARTMKDDDDQGGRL